MGWRGFSRSSITAPGDRVGTDHVTGKIKRLQGASYPVQEASYPVRARSLTDSLHRTHARLQCRNCEKRPVRYTVAAQVGSGRLAGRCLRERGVLEGSNADKFIIGSDPAVVTPCQVSFLVAARFSITRPAVRHFLARASTLRSVSSRCALSSTRRDKTLWSFPSSATELLIELRDPRPRCRKQVSGSQPVRRFATSLSGVLE